MTEQGPDSIKTVPSARPDGPSLAAFATLCSYTWFLYGIGPSLPLFRDELGISRTLIGLHSLMMAAGIVLAGFLGVGLARRWRRYGLAGRGVILMTASGLLFIGGSLLPSGDLVVTLPAMLLVGLGGSFAVNVSTTVLQEHNGALGPALLSTGNAAAAGVGLVTPLAVGAATALGLTWRAALALVVPFALLALILMRRHRGVPAYTARPVGNARFSFRGMPQAYWLAMSAVVCGVAIEFCMITWTPDLLTARAGMSPGAASGAVAAVVGGMAVGRLLTGALARRHTPLALFVAGVAVTIAGWVLLWLATAPTIAVIALLIVGTGVAGLYPLGAAMVMSLSAGQPDRAIALMGIGVGLSSGLGPFLLGALADEVGVRAAFFVVPALCLGAAGTIVAGARWAGRTVRP